MYEDVEQRIGEIRIVQTSVGTNLLRGLYKGLLF